MPESRIVSLVPSLTELMIDLGLEENLVGRTRFCIHPASSVQGVPIIGGTKNPNINKIRALSPDIVIANKEENRKEDIERIQKFANVIVTDISSIDEALQWIQNLGDQLSVSSTSKLLLAQINEQLVTIGKYKSVDSAYFIWKNPWMTVGNDTYIHDVMKRLGLINIFEDKLRYPEIIIEELILRKPELILLSSEPFPFKKKHLAELQAHLPSTEVQLVDGEWFSWYGSRMLLAFQHLNEWRRNLSI